MNLGDILLSVLPMVLLIGAWFFFMQRMRQPNSYQSQHADLIRRQTEALERIATVLERRA